MRGKLSLTLGLAALAAGVVAGNAGGQGEVLGSGESGVEIDLADGAQLEDLQAIPQCSNLGDDDGDGLTDLEDPECAGPLDANEAAEAVPPAEPEPAPPTEPGQPVDPAEVPVVPGGEVFKPEGGRPGPGGDGGRGSSGERAGGGPSGGQAAGDGEDDDDAPDSGGLEPRRDDGTPTRANPSLTIADFGPAPIGVPNFVIDQFSIPPFLLPIYQACGTEYGVPWQVLASINRIETAFGTNLNVSSAGALGWMQFMPSTWEAYGVDANDDGRKDPYNPVDAICAAARYLRRRGRRRGPPRRDLRLQPRRLVRGRGAAVREPVRQAARADLVGSLTGLTEGAHFPVAANARYADDISEREAAEALEARPARVRQRRRGDLELTHTPRDQTSTRATGAPVVAVNDGVDRRGSARLEAPRPLRRPPGRLRQPLHLRRARRGLARSTRSRSATGSRADDFELVSPAATRKPGPPAPAATTRPRPLGPTAIARAPSADTEDSRERLFALPERPRNVDRADLSGQLDELLDERFPGYESFKAYFSGVLRFDRKTMELRPLREGSQGHRAARSSAGSARPTSSAPHLHFAIRPAGRGAPRIDPKPILDGWKLLEATAIYRAAGKNPFAGQAPASARSC